MRRDTAGYSGLRQLLFASMTAGTTCGTCGAGGAAGGGGSTGFWVVTAVMALAEGAVRTWISGIGMNGGGGGASLGGGGGGGVSGGFTSSISLVSRGCFSTSIAEWPRPVTNR